MKMKVLHNRGLTIKIKNIHVIVPLNIFLLMFISSSSIIVTLSLKTAQSNIFRTVSSC